LELIDLDITNNNNQRDNFRQLKEQLSDIKRMMTDTLKSIIKNKENNNINDTNNNNNNNIDDININDNIYNQAVALFADFLLRYLSSS